MTLYLIRHASAGTRSETNDDLDRTLDPTGFVQAKAVAELLADKQITQIYSSQATRCVQTVEPLAELLALHVQVDPSLLEGQSATMAVHLARTLAQADTRAALCSHGDIIPDTIQTLAREGMVIVGPRSWAKGSTWELGTRGGDITEARFLGPY